MTIEARFAGEAYQQAITEQMQDSLMSVQRFIDNLSYYDITIPAELRELNPTSRIKNHTTLLQRLFPFYTQYSINCHHCNHQVLRRHSIEIYNNDNVVRFRVCGHCAPRNYYRWRSDYLYHDEREPRAAIGEYHGGDREILSDDVDFTQPDLLGLEVETYLMGNSRDVNRIAKEAREIGYVVPERDGSLDQTNGVEFVFRPVKFDSILEPGNWVKATIDHLHNNSDTWSMNGYGIHISVNASMMPRLHVSKFCNFIHNYRQFCERLAGRLSNSYADYGRDHDSRYAAASIRSGERVEVRIFRSSTKWERVKRYCEFVDAVRGFSLTTDNADMTLPNFKKWVNEDNSDKYVELHKWINNETAMSVE